MRLAERSPAGLEQVEVLITPAGGKPHKVVAELAASPAEQQRGLMFRESLAPDRGMLFPYDPPRPVAFWMKNTVIPLDIIYIGPDHRVLNVAAETVPYSEEQLPSDGAVSAVLELAGGRAAQLGIRPGTQVDWPR